jgi:hypothetical protein
VDEEKSCSDAGQHLLPSVRVTAASARAADHHTTSPIFAIFLTNPAPSLEVAGACCAITLNDDGPQSLWVLVRYEFQYRNLFSSDKFNFPKNHSPGRRPALALAGVAPPSA